jgi:hypothetical protein
MYLALIMSAPWGLMNGTFKIIINVSGPGNRYGNDDQYLFTVIRFNLEALNLCPLLASVEIIDAKAKVGRCRLTLSVPR